MKLQSVNIVFVLGVVELARMASGLCLVRNTDKPKVYSYECFRTKNYLADVQTAPIDIPEIKFNNGKIPVIKNRSFSRLSSALESLKISFCGVKEIEDNAFEGLAKLGSLRIAFNHLQIIKGTWFKGLSNLKTISLENNEIKRIENNFFSIVPPLEKLDVSRNQLSCFPMASLEIFKTKVFHFRHNPLSWGCVSLMMDWVERTGVQYDEFGRGNFDPSSELVFDCEDKLGKPHNQLNEENIKKCAEKTVNDLLPPQENYTMKDVCQYLKNKPSPFLTCS